MTLSTATRAACLACLAASFVIDKRVASVLACAATSKAAAVMALPIREVHVDARYATHPIGRDVLVSVVGVDIMVVLVIVVFVMFVIVIVVVMVAIVVHPVVFQIIVDVLVSRLIAVVVVGMVVMAIIMMLVVSCDILAVFVMSMDIMVVFVVMVVVVVLAVIVVVMIIVEVLVMVMVVPVVVVLAIVMKMIMVVLVMMMVIVMVVVVVVAVAVVVTEVMMMMMMIIVVVRLVVVMIVLIVMVRVMIVIVRIVVANMVMSIMMLLVVIKVPMPILAVVVARIRPTQMLNGLVGLDMLQPVRRSRQVAQTRRQLVEDGNVVGRRIDSHVLEQAGHGPGHQRLQVLVLDVVLEALAVSVSIVVVCDVQPSRRCPDQFAHAIVVLVVLVQCERRELGLMAKQRVRGAIPKPKGVAVAFVATIFGDVSKHGLSHEMSIADDLVIAVQRKLPMGRSRRCVFLPVPVAVSIVLRVAVRRGQVLQCCGGPHCCHWRGLGGRGRCRRRRRFGRHVGGIVFQVSLQSLSVIIKNGHELRDGASLVEALVAVLVAKHGLVDELRGLARQSK